MTCHRMGEIPTCRKNGNPSKGLCVVIDAITYRKGKEHQGQTGCNSKSTSYAQPIRRFSAPKPLHRVLNRGGWKRKIFQEPLGGAWRGVGLSGFSRLSGLSGLSGSANKRDQRDQTNTKEGKVLQSNIKSNRRPPALFSPTVAIARVTLVITRI